MKKYLFWVVQALMVAGFLFVATNKTQVEDNLATVLLLIYVFASALNLVRYMRVLEVDPEPCLVIFFACVVVFIPVAVYYFYNLILVFFGVI